LDLNYLGAQQSQVSFDNINVEIFPKFQQVSATEAILFPGDVLYLPPMWFHHVTALTLSMSVSVWTSFEVTQNMYKTVRTILPFKSSWSKDKIALSGRLYLEALIDSLYGQVLSISMPLIQ
jgi:ribosomal protein L16 Arg81 hydroxylase